MANFNVEDIKTDESVVQQIHARVAEILNVDGVETKAFTEFDEWRAIAKENGDLQEIAALCIAQLMLEV